MVISLNFDFNESGFSSDPARKVSIIAATPAINFIQSVSSANFSVNPDLKARKPTIAPIIISISAFEILRRFAITVEMSADKNQKAATI
jgi:hypothetical protein